MTDDIFDYFGGNSPRKIEPIEHDDLFEDLMPKTEPEPVEESEPAEEVVAVEDDVVELAVGDDADSIEIVASDSNDDDDEHGDGESHWDDLASSLGLDVPASVPKVRAKKKDKPKPKKVKPMSRKKPAARSEEIIEDVEVVESGVAASADDDDDFFGFDTAAKKDSDPPEVLKELFVPRDEKEFESPSDADSSSKRIVDDVDPFAAFHGAGDIVDEVDMDPVEDEPFEDDDVDTDSELTISDDFVEFEVKDLEKGESDGGRKPRSKRRGRDEEKSESRRDEAKGRGRRDSRDRDDSRRDENKSRGRRRNTHRDEVVDRDVKESRSDTRDEPKRKRRERPERERQEQTAEHDGEKPRSKKKPKIPTWDDAIGGVVEQNIKRHKSGSSGRGGGKRRRR